jgi:DNA-binding MarR family transcriptional regulator
VYKQSRFIGARGDVATKRTRDKSRARPGRFVPGYILEDQVGHLLRRAHQRHAALFLDRLGALDLTPTQFAALVKIGDLRGVSQNLLGRLTAMDPSTTQGVVRRLVARQLVAMSPDPVDQRFFLLRLTGSGRRVAREAIARARLATEATLAPLAPKQREHVVTLLRRLG